MPVIKTQQEIVGLLSPYPKGGEKSEPNLKLLSMTVHQGGNLSLLLDPSLLTGL